MLAISQDQMETILRHVRSAAPLEACGLLAGRGATVLRVYPLSNEDRSEVSYRLNPEEQYHVFVEIEAQGQQLIGIYHSHPQTVAYPSTRDIEAAYYPEAVYLIVSLIDETSPEVRAFRIRNGDVQEEQLVLFSDKGHCPDNRTDHS